MSAVELVDFHNHVIPGVDDGASDDDEALFALRSFIEQGVHHVIATPHVDGSLTLRRDALVQRLQEIDAGWARLQQLALQHLPQLRIGRGAEVMLDTPEPDLSDARLRLAGGPFALVEFPFMSVPPHSARVLQVIAAAGYTPVVAHPERYAGITPESELPEEWRRAGAVLQVNAGSLSGRYGPGARANALALLDRALVSYLCSDYHARGRPAMGGARRALEEAGALEQIELLMSVNPRRLADGQMPLPVPPLPMQRGLMQRVRRWLR